MSEEVKRRLDEVKMLGRLITMKIMKRKQNAPIEPPKVCRSVILSKICSNPQRVSFSDTERATHSINKGNSLAPEVTLSTTTKLLASMLGDYSNHSISIQKS